MEGPQLRIVALVPARGGSKGIPGKNTRPMAGRPLLCWVLDALSGCDGVEETLVATDDDGIRSVVESYGHPRVRCIDRSPATATDDASTESVLLEVAAAVDADALLLVQATSPLLRTTDVEVALRELARPDVDSVLSVVRQHRFRWTSAEGHVRPVNYDPAARPRRQDFAGELVENGALYLSARERILESGVRISGRVAAVEMGPESYLEVDDASDWAMVEAALVARQARDRRARKPIRAVLSDVDGVLTDAGMYYSSAGDAMKRFNTRDGLGFELLRDAGILTGIITREDTPIVEQRAAKLRLDELHMGVRDKLAVGRAIAEAHGFDLAEIAYVGDDLGDLPLLRAVGLSAAPADAVPEVRRHVDLVCSARGGTGVLREVADAVLAGEG